jgi:hypothetical protein
MYHYNTQYDYNDLMHDIYCLQLPPRVTTAYWIRRGYVTFTSGPVLNGGWLGAVVVTSPPLTWTLVSLMRHIRICRGDSTPTNLQQALRYVFSYLRLPKAFEMVSVKHHTRLRQAIM